MPQEELFTPSVSPPEKGGVPPQLHVDVEPAAFGVGVAKAKEEQATELGRVGKTLAERGFELQDFANDAEANQRIIGTGQRLSDAKAKYLQSEKHDAAGARVVYNNEVAGIFKDADAAIQNPAVKRKVGDFLARRIERDEEIAATHAATEATKADKQDRQDRHKLITDDAATTISETGANVKVISDLAEEAAANASTGAYVTNDPVTGMQREINEPVRAAERARSDVIEKSIRTALNNEENGAQQAYELYKYYTDIDPKLDKDPVIRRTLLGQIHQAMKEQIATRGAALALKGLPPTADPYTVQRLEQVERPWRDVFKRMHNNNPSLEVGVPGLGGPAGFEDLLAPIRKREGWDKPGTTFTSENMARMLSGETAAKWYNAAPNSAGYAGFFQLPVKDPAHRHPDAKVTWTEMKAMSFKEQLDLYVQYLKDNHYTGTEHLGVMQGAPAYKDRPDNFLAYPKGSKEAAANPGWRVASGDVYIGSMKRHYDTKSTGMSGDTMKVWPYKNGQPMSKDDPGFEEAFQKVKEAAGVAMQDLGVKGTIGDDGILKYDKGYSVDQYRPPADETIEKRIENGNASIAAKFPEFKYELQADFRRAMLGEQAQHNQMDRLQGYEDSHKMVNYLLTAKLPNGMSVINFDSAPPDVRSIAKRVQNDDPELYDRIQKWAIRNAQQGFRITPENTNYTYRLRELAFSGNSADRDEFMKIMSSGEWATKGLASEQLKLLDLTKEQVQSDQVREDNDHIESIAHDKGIQAQLNALHWDEKHNRNMYLTWRGATRELIRMRKIDLQRPLTPDERLEIGMDALVATRPTTTLFGWVRSAVPELSQKPSTDQEKKTWESIHTRLKEDYGGSEPPVWQIQAIYAAFQRRHSLEKAGKVPTLGEGEPGVGGVPTQPKEVPADKWEKAQEEVKAAVGGAKRGEKIPTPLADVLRERFREKPTEPEPVPKKSAAERSAQLEALEKEERGARREVMGTTAWKRKMQSIAERRRAIEGEEAAAGETP